MKMVKIAEQYKDEWVLIEYTKLDEQLNAQEGTVVAHSPSKEEIYQLLKESKGKKIAIEYTGKFPQDVAVMF